MSHGRESAVSTPCWAYHDSDQHSAPALSHRKSSRQQDQYKDWDFLKSHDSQVIHNVEMHSGRKQPTQNQLRQSYNIIAPPTIEYAADPNAHKVLSVDEISRQTKTKTIARANKHDHIKSVREMAYGGWCDDDKNAPATDNTTMRTTLSGEALIKRTSLGLPSRQDVLQEKLKEERGKDYYQVISIPELAHEPKSTGSKRLDLKAREATTSTILQGTVIPKPDEEFSPEAQDSAAEFPPEMRPNFDGRFKGGRRRREEAITFAREKETVEKKKEEVKEYRVRLAQEQALKNLEKDSDIIRYGLQPNPDLYKASKKMYEVNCNTQSFQDDTKPFGPHMRRVAPAHHEKTDDDSVPRGRRVLSPRSEPKPQRQPHKSENRPSTALGRSQNLAGKTVEQGVQKWTMGSIYAASGQARPTSALS